MPPGRASSPVAERRARVRRVVHDARRVDEVEGAALQAGPRQVGLDELHALEAESRAAAAPSASDARVRSAPTTMRSALREVQAHLAGAASDVDDARISGNRAVEQTREGIALGARAQRRAALSRGG